MTLYVYCADCEFTAEWEGGSAAEDPAVEHAANSGHRVKTTTAERPDLERGEA